MIQLSRETILAAREKYLAGTPVEDICAELKISRGTLYYWLHGGPGENNENRLPPIPLRYACRTVRATPRKHRRKQLVERVWRAAELQVREIEQRMVLTERAPDERERDARLLVMMVKTLRELCALNPVALSASDKPKNADPTDDPDYDDIEELRLALARRLEGIVAERAGAGAGADEAA